MLIIPPPNRSKQRRAATPKPVALSLVAAAFTYPNRVDLTFDRAINIAAMNVASVIVDDSDSGDRFHGSGTPTLLSANQVRVPLAMVGPVSVPNTYLTAGSGTNLAAVDDDGTWAGVTNVELPLP